MTSDRPFRAFVSYCHADARFAAWLQRRLEAYRLPTRLAGEVPPLPGQPQGRIGPVFRDRADLSAATDLSAAVRGAIAASSALVVVASPDAARSHWVEREIELFRELHPEALILVALARGDPAKSLPAPLLSGGAEPLAADFRKEGDGRRLAFLKVVAGLAGLPLDALVQRDAQRQLRRVTAVTLGAVVLLVILALLLVAALRAREEAERQREAAEGVVEAMLTDVRREVRRTGNLKLRAAINELALGYYAKQGAWEDLSDGSIERRARVLHALGEDDLAAGDYPAARAKFAEAHRATADVLDGSPRDADAVFAHAQSEFWLGRVGFESNDQARALQRWQNYLDLAETLSRLESGAPRSLLELGYAHGNLCEVNMRDARDVAAGLDHCRMSLEFERAALAAKPGDEEILKALANRLGWMADALMTVERYAEARAHRQEEAAIMSTLVATNPNDAEIRERAVWPLIGLAKVDVAEGRLDQGLARYRQSLRELDRLGADFPDNQLILAQRIRVNVLLAAALRRAGRPEWTAYRNRAEALLYGGPPRPGRARTPRPGLERQHQMFEKLEQGDGK